MHPASRSGSTSIRRQICSPHSSGGLGAVYLAGLGAVYLAGPRWDRLTDRRIAASLNAPYSGEHNKKSKAAKSFICSGCLNPVTSAKSTATDVVGRQRLRSATQQLMVVPRHRLTTVGRRAFAVHGPMVWNSLPDDLRAQQDYQSFRQGLKTWLFSRY